MTETEKKSERKGFSGLKVLGIVVLTVIVTILVGWWVVRTYVFPSQFRPVALNTVEMQVLDDKLERLGIGEGAVRVNERGEEVAVPVPYSEADADRDVFLTERELNGLIAKDPELGSRVAIDLADDLASVVVLIPIPEDFPFMPGRTLRVRSGAEVAFRDGRPVVALKGVSVMGVPVPNAWLGDLKDVDLVQRFGGRDGIWTAFASGVEGLAIEEGRLHIRLRE